MWEGEALVDQLIRDHDTTSMALPNIELEPHLLISKVRKHYMEYLIKLLSENYESNQRLVNKNIYLPSAIWRCAKILEIKAAQACMVVQLYRRNLMDAINELKKDTKNGKLNRLLYECLHRPPDNEKKLQTTGGNLEDSLCQCSCANRKRSRKMRESPTPQPDSQTQDLPKRPKTNEQAVPFPDCGVQAMVAPTLPSSSETSKPLDKSPGTMEMAAMLADSQSQDSDELMMQLEKLFKADPTDDDLFDSAFGDALESGGTNKGQQQGACDSSVDQTNSTVIESHSAQIKSLDERLASLAGLLVNTTATESLTNQRSRNHIESEKPNKLSCTKWYCEEYYLKSQFYELLEHIGDCSRKKLERIKAMLVVLFGEDSDDGEVVSPLDESSEMVISCKERIAPWVVRVLTPHYVKGRIKGKVVFKSLAKHLIRIIYQCSRYPNEYEVKNFVTDFLASHQTICCEADFKQFKIDNF